MMGNRPSQDDQELSLIKRIADGDREAFRQLYARYERHLYAYLMRMMHNRKPEAEELVVDCLFAVWQEAKRFKGNSKLSTWIFGIAHNQALNARRQMAGKSFVNLDEAEALKSAKPSPLELAEQSDVQAKIKALLEQLSDDQREVIELTFYQGFTYEEIARIIGSPVNTVKTRVFYAKQKLKELLNEIASA